MAFNTVVILLNSERKELMCNALSTVLTKNYSNNYTQVFIQQVLEPYNELLKDLDAACDNLILTSHTGAIDCMCYALDCMNEENAEKLAFEIRRVDRQANMCKKNDYMTCTLNLSNQISTRLTYE